MRRRDLLGAAGTGTLAGLAGCMGGLLNSGSSSELLPPEERPDAVYVPTHYGGMKMVGTKRSGSYECALTYISPHAFWLVTGDRKEKVEVKDADSVHLMPVVWESETGIVPPDINPQVSVTQSGEEVTQLKPWPMLSQRMGFHFGDNVQLGGDGTYRVEVNIGAPTARRTGALADNEGDESFSFELDFEESKLSDIAYHDVPPEKEGTKGAVDPMSMEMLPSTRVPKPGALPGTVRGDAVRRGAPVGHRPGDGLSLRRGRPERRVGRRTDDFGRCTPADRPPRGLRDGLLRDGRGDAHALTEHSSAYGGGKDSFANSPPLVSALLFIGPPIGRRSTTLNSRFDFDESETNHCTNRSLIP